MDATGLPGSIRTVSLLGDGRAIGPVSEGSCAGFKSDCSERSYLIATEDGGRTWVPVRG